jgi:hypothetical protein
LARARFIEKSTLQPRFAFELRNSICGLMELLINRGAFPVERVNFAACFVKFAFGGSDLEYRGSVIAARGLVAFPNFLQPIGGGIELPLNLEVSVAEILLLGEERLMLGRERCDLRFAREKRAVLLGQASAVDDAFGRDQFAGQSSEGESWEFLPQPLCAGEIFDENDFA